MDRTEYLKRVFQSQINSLKRDIENYMNEIDHLESGLREANLNVKESTELLKIAEAELRKLGE